MNAVLAVRRFGQGLGLWEVRGGRGGDQPGGEEDLALDDGAAASVGTGAATTILVPALVPY